MKFKPSVLKFQYVHTYDQSLITTLMVCQMQGPLVREQIKDTVYNKIFEGARFSRILAKCKCFTIETFPASLFLYSNLRTL